MINNNKNKIPYKNDDFANNNDNNKGRDKNKNNPINIKPLIGSDGRPVIDKNNKPIMLDDNNRPVKGTGISLLLDQIGMPILNTIGEPILINKDGKPINLIDKQDKDNNFDNPKIVYPKIKQKDNSIKYNKKNKRSD